MDYRNCPRCNSIINYSNSRSFKEASRKNSICKSCSKKGIKFSDEHRKKLSESASKKIGIQNPFYGYKHSEETKEKIRNHNIGKKYSDEINKSKGRVGRSPSNKGISLSEETKNKISLATSGKNNPMYGKPSPIGSGNGWSGWYKNHYFRSIKELSFIINYLERFNLKWESGESKKFQIKYKDWEGKIRNYYPDFFINDSFLVEIKPKKLWNNKIVKLKKTQAENFCKNNNIKYKLIDPILIDEEMIESLICEGHLIFIDRYKKKYEKQKINNLRANGIRKNLSKEKA
jgi:hypothetical protein